MIEQWVFEKLEPLRNERIILLHDPQRMIPTGSAQINQWAEQHKFVVIVPSGNLVFRDQYEQVREKEGLKLILVDRTRETDGKKSKLPLFYTAAGWKCPVGKAVARWHTERRLDNSKWLCHIPIWTPAVSQKLA